MRALRRCLVVSFVVAITLVALDADRASAQVCPGGQVATPSTLGHCCWPGQAWEANIGRCVGAPACPAPYVTQGTECVSSTGPVVVEAMQPAYTGTQTYGASPYTPPTEYESRPTVWMIVVGAILFGVAWLSTPLVTAAIGADPADIGYNAIPIAGPFVCMAACEDPDPYLAALGTSGAFQIAGLVLMILGGVITHDVPVRDAAASFGVVLAGTELRFSPSVGSHHAGLGLALDF